MIQSGRENFTKSPGTRSVKNFTSVFREYLPVAYWIHPFVTLVTSTWIIIPPASRKLKGSRAYWFHLVRPSVRLWTQSCLLCIFNNTRRIHFIFAHLIKQLQKVRRIWCLFQISKICNFGKFFKFVALTLSSFDSGSNMTQSWGGGGYPQNAGVLVVLVWIVVSELVLCMDGSLQDCHISSVLAMKILQSCTIPISMVTSWLVHAIEM